MLINCHKTKMLVSILMESPLYMTLPVDARHSILVRLLETYPSLFDSCTGCTEAEVDFSPNSCKK
jgi:hypothetical protein